MAELTQFAQVWASAWSAKKSSHSSQPEPYYFRLFAGLDVEKYQRHVLAGYTVRELMELGAFSNRELKPSTLNNLIHQIMLRDQWSLRDRPPI